MDPKLAEIYGTNQASESDVEKLAAAELAEELSENDEANIDGMSDEQIEALAAQVLAGAEGEEQEQVEEQSEEETDQDPESLEKISEADYLGRVMAHSYVNELRSIDAEMQKEAASKEGPQTAAQSAARDAKRAKTPNHPTFSAKARNKADSAKKAVKGAGGKVMSAIKNNPKKAAGGGLAALLAAGGGAAAYKHKKNKEKNSSALDALAEQRALEILAENGIDINEETEKVSSGEQEVLAQAVEARAYAMLENAGYIQNDEE